jgi:hypothetical protein
MASAGVSVGNSSGAHPRPITGSRPISSPGDDDDLDIPDFLK